jgi:hypothetical protein
MASLLFFEKLSFVFGRESKRPPFYGSAFVQTTRAWRNTYIGGESREGEFLISSQFQR